MSGSYGQGKAGFGSVSVWNNPGLSSCRRPLIAGISGGRILASMEKQPANPKDLRKAALIGGVSLTLGLIFNYLFYEKIPGIGFLAYILLVIIGLFIISGAVKKELSGEARWLLIPVIFFSAMVFVRASVMLIFLNIIGVILLLLVIAALSHSERLGAYLLVDYFKVIFLPIRFIVPLVYTLAAIFTSINGNRDQQTILQIKRGIAITIPFIFIFLVLFSSADLMFQKYLNQIFDIKPEIILRLFWIIVATFAFIGSYSYMFKPEQTIKEKLQTQKAPFKIGHIESSILFGSVNVLFFFFILVQFTYLFGGQSNIATQGFTYSEYARRGFGELVWVAIILLFLLLTTEKYVRTAESEHTAGFKLLSTALVVQVTLIIASAFMRLLLYEQAYGFTTLRLYSHCFVIWLALVFLFVLIKIDFDKRENTFAVRVFISMILFLAFMNFLNPDSFIAKRNIERYNVTGRLDTDYLFSLSDDAIPELVKVLENADSNALPPLTKELYQRYSNRKDYSYYQGWQSMNLSRMQAEKILRVKIEELGPLESYD